MKWISVRDSLPKLNEPVLLCNENNIVLVEIFRLRKLNFTVKHTDLIWTSNNSAIGGEPIKNKNGFHWMPMPAAPKEGDKKESETTRKNKREELAFRILETLLSNKFHPQSTQEQDILARYSVLQVDAFFKAIKEISSEQ